MIPYDDLKLASFGDALQELINMHGIDSKTGIPDYILTDHILSCVRNLCFTVDSFSDHVKIVTQQVDIVGNEEKPFV
jgi:hypothetical protein